MDVEPSTGDFRINILVIRDQQHFVHQTVPDVIVSAIPPEIQMRVTLSGRIAIPVGDDCMAAVIAADRHDHRHLRVQAGEKCIFEIRTSLVEIVQLDRPRLVECVHVVPDERSGLVSEPCLQDVDQNRRGRASVSGAPLHSQGDGEVVRQHADSLPLRRGGDRIVIVPFQKHVGPVERAGDGLPRDRRAINHARVGELGD